PADHVVADVEVLGLLDEHSVACDVAGDVPEDVDATNALNVNGYRSAVNHVPGDGRVEIVRVRTDRVNAGVVIDHDRIAGQSEIAKTIRDGFDTVADHAHVAEWIKRRCSEPNAVVAILNDVALDQKTRTPDLGGNTRSVAG